MKTSYIIDLSLDYGTKPPFYPSEKFPEITSCITTELGDNHLYTVLRKLLKANNLDLENYGKETWNPLGYLIKPGQHVVLKPNWVFDVRGREQLKESLTTHGAFIRIVLDYVIIALRGKGKISICDAPLQSASFSSILEDNHMKEIISSYKKINNIVIECLDLRLEEAQLDSTMSKIIGINKLSGDPLGYTEIDLGASSYLNELCIKNPQTRFAVGDYDENITKKNHRLGVHKYLISKTVLASDVFINLPKMKTHRKTGITGALKNLIGINGSKAYLAHYSIGGKENDGDEFEDYSFTTQAASYIDRKLKPFIPNIVWKGMRFLWSTYKKNVLKKLEDGKKTSFSLLTSGGGWYGNQTIWRTVYDINTILFFADKRGNIHTTPQRAYLAIVDGIIGCEGEGPLHGKPCKAGTIIMGCDPVAVDVCMSHLMGFDIRKIPILSNISFINPSFRFSSFRGETDFIDVGNSPFLIPFSPPITWKNHIEKGR